MNQAIGILGGTFDPIHFGHLRTALEVAEQLQLAKVHLVPAFTPVHRDLPVASPYQRLEMALLATANEPRLYVDPREIRRKNASYTIETLQELRNEYGTDTPLCLILGADSFYSLPTWHRYTEFLGFCHLIVIARPGFSPPTEGEMVDLLDAHRQASAYLQKHNAGGIITLTTSSLQISASGIRKEIAQGENPRYLLPNDVYNYIQHNGIYRQ